MKRDDLYAFMHDYCKQAERLSRKKNGDYADNDDPFMNFTQCGEIGIVTRMTDKMTRLKNLVFREFQGLDGPVVNDESLDDTIMDLFNYAWLLAAYRENTRLDDDLDWLPLYNENYKTTGTGGVRTQSDYKPIDVNSLYTSSMSDTLGPTGTAEYTEALSAWMDTDLSTPRPKFEDYEDYDSDPRCTDPGCNDCRNGEDRPYRGGS